MATRAQLRAWLRRRLQETTPAQWTDSTLNSYLNEGLYFMQQEIEKIEPEAFVYVDTANTVADQDLYAMPTNMKSDLELEYKAASSSEYATVPKRDRRFTRENTTGLVYYAHQGRYFLIRPVPSNSVSAGLRLTYVPILTMGSDSDVPILNIDLHMGIVLAAQLTALGDVDESTGKEAVRTELAQMILRIPLHYQKTSAEPDRFSVDDNVKLYPTELS